MEEDGNADDGDLDRERKRHHLELVGDLVVVIRALQGRIVFVQVKREEPADRDDARQRVQPVKPEVAFVAGG